MADDWRAQRLARNEVLVRGINERLEQDLIQLGIAGLQEFVCECGDRDCSEIVQLTLQEYEHTRARPGWFFVVPGHVYPEVEQVVERHDRFELLEKIGATAQIAASTDPRG
jgi:hypothetical protein